MSHCLLIRADASARIGTGHVMRCLALAQRWRRSGGIVVFVYAEMTVALESRLSNEGIQCQRLSVAPGGKEDAVKTAEIAKNQNAAWVVADSYKFGLDYQKDIKAAGLRLLLFDDFGHAREYVADFVLNQNVGADASLYARRAPNTRLLLGTHYALLREEFLIWRDWNRNIPPIARKVLVTLGGSDPDNVTFEIVEALQYLSEFEIKIVVGGSNPHVEQLKSEIDNRESKIELVVNATNMPQLMAWADVAISSGGTTVLELCFMGLPSLVLVLADNQNDMAASLADLGAAVNLGLAYDVDLKMAGDVVQDLIADQERRANMSERGRLLVDGLGSSRVASALELAS